MHYKVNLGREKENRGSQEGLLRGRDLDEAVERYFQRKDRKSGLGDVHQNYHDDHALKQVAGNYKQSTPHMENKRNNARNLGFGFRASNISSINDNISSLLRFIKNDDKQSQGIDKSKGKNYKIVHQNHPKIQEITPQQEASELQRRELKVKQKKLLTEVSREQEKYKQPQTRYEHLQLQSKRSQISPINNLKPQNSKRKYIDETSKSLKPLTPAKHEKPMRKYLPEQDQKKSSYIQRQQATVNVCRNQIEQKISNMQRYEIKLETNNRCTTPKANLICRQNQSQNQKFLKSTPKKKQSEPQSKFLQIYIEPKVEEKKNPNSKIKANQLQVDDFESTIPKPQYSHFTPILPCNEVQRNQKLSTTSQMLDDQITRIRSKIEQSTTSNRRNLQISSLPLQSQFFP